MVGEGKRESLESVSRHDHHRRRRRRRRRRRHHGILILANSGGGHLREMSMRARAF